MSRTLTSPARRPRAAALLLVLWVVVLLSIVLTSFALTARTQMHVVTNIAEAATLDAIAEAGVERAIAAIKSDTVRPDTLREEWFESDRDYRDVAIGAGTFSLERVDVRGPDPLPAWGIEDEASKLNLRTATKEMLEAFGGLTPPQIDALLDWQDGDSDVRDAGAEDAVYFSRRNDPHPAKNRALDTLIELLRIDGYDPNVLWGEDWNRNGKLDPNENDGAASLPPDNQDGVLDPGIYPYVTLWSRDAEKSADGRERVNINDASEDELKKAISGLTDEEAKAIVEHRGSSKFERVGQLVDVKKPEEKKESSEGGQENQGNTNQNANRPDMFDNNRLKQIVDYCRVDGDTEKVGRVNINTAPSRVLRALPGLDQAKAAAIVARREDGTVFRSIADLLDVGGISREDFSKISPHVTVASDQFRVRSVARIEGLPRTRTVTAVLDRSGEQVRILYWNRE